MPVSGDQSADVLLMPVSGDPSADVLLIIVRGDSERLYERDLAPRGSGLYHESVP